MIAQLEKILPVIATILLLAVAGGAYAYYDLSRTHTQTLSSTSEKITSLETELTAARQTNEDLAYSLTNEKQRTDELQEQIEDLTGTVEDLEKLSNTDDELLQKYSKVYFLNENYIPDGLREVDARYVIPEGKVIEIHRKVAPFLRDLLDEAEDEGLNLKVASGYRSFGTQADLKAGYRVTYGSGANTFSAEQGFSEHQLGTTLDFVTPTTLSFSGFENTEEYEWLLDNAYKYGFALSYPPGNAYYVYEPWHWRFVGKDLAAELRKDKKYFYDLDQRELDDYLLTIFDH